MKAKEKDKKEEGRREEGWNVVRKVNFKNEE